MTAPTSTPQRELGQSRQLRAGRCCPTVLPSRLQGCSFGLDVVVHHGFHAQCCAVGREAALPLLLVGAEDENPAWLARPGQRPLDTSADVTR